MNKLSPPLEFVAPAQWRALSLRDAVAAFEERCARRAAMVARGIATKQEAVDALQGAAIAFGLVEDIGQDRVQEIMGRAFT